MGNCGMIAGAFSSTSGKADTVLTTSGDVLYYTSSRQRLPIGNEGTVLTVSDADLPAWETVGGLSSPLTANLVVNDNINLLFGTGSDSSIDYNGTNLVFDPQVVGGGDILINAGAFYMSAPTTLTLSSGAVSATRNIHAIDTEGGASTDNCDVINVPQSNSGNLLIVSSSSSSRDVTFKDGRGNLVMAGDFTATNSNDKLTFLCTDNANYFELSRSDVN